MSTVQELPRLLTADELLRMPDDDRRRELVRGELRIFMPPSAEHGSMAVRLVRKIDAFVSSHHLGEVLVESGFKLAGDPDTVRGPDISVVLNERAAKIGPGFFPGSPDLAVEIVSPSDTYDEVQDKIEDYLSLGTREVWVVRLKQQSITIHANATAERTFRRGDTLRESAVLPGFELPIAELFSTGG